MSIQWSEMARINLSCYNCFLRKDVFEETKFPELSKAVKYFKETEGGFGEMCKTVEDYAKDYAEEREEIVREEERKNAIRKNAGKWIIQRNDSFYELFRERIESG